MKSVLADLPAAVNKSTTAIRNRLHMASLGHSLVADEVYGGHLVAAMNRQALHACRLAFVHPVSGGDHVFEAPPPKDFAGLLTNMGLSYN